MEIVNRRKILYQATSKLLFGVLFFILALASADSSIEKPRVIPDYLTWYVNWTMTLFMCGVFIYDNLDLIKNRIVNNGNINTIHRYKFLKMTKFLFSTKTHKEIFVPIMADWDLEVFEASQEKERIRLIMINLRNIYSFLLTIWMKSPIGDLIEFVSKLFK